MTPATKAATKVNATKKPLDALATKDSQGKIVKKKFGAVTMKQRPVEVCSVEPANPTENANAWTVTLARIAKRANSIATTRLFLVLAMGSANRMANANAIPSPKARIVKWFAKIVFSKRTIAVPKTKVNAMKPPASADAILAGRVSSVINKRKTAC